MPMLYQISLELLTLTLIAFEDLLDIFLTLSEAVVCRMCEAYTFTHTHTHTQRN